MTVGYMFRNFNAAIGLFLNTAGNCPIGEPSVEHGYRCMLSDTDDVWSLDTFHS